MFIREKRVNGVIYRSLIESYREGGKVRQRLLYTLGKKCKPLAECIAWERGPIGFMRSYPQTFSEEMLEHHDRLIAQLEVWECVVSKSEPSKEFGQYADCSGKESAQCIPESPKLRGARREIKGQSRAGWTLIADFESGINGSLHPACAWLPENCASPSHPHRAYRFADCNQSSPLDRGLGVEGRTKGRQAPDRENGGGERE
jgi:hypothetical protein